ADDGKWRMIIGSNKDNTGMAFLYQTEDFINWTRYDSPLHKVEGCGVWECPDFFPVWVDSTDGVDTSVINPSDQVKHVLKVGLLETGKDYYMIGNYIPEKELYIPKNDLTLSTLRYDYGKYYASKSFFDPVKKRRILMAWVNESHPEADAVARGWSSKTNGLDKTTYGGFVDIDPQQDEISLRTLVLHVDLVRPNKVRSDESLSSDNQPYRTAFHFQPSRNW
nr:fructan 6-exohydrolase-like [Tanacetum cinerariifolium]GEZ90885.1 fructan 6-exohydrolase-like [Tanacetum cinerariifolium]